MNENNERSDKEGCQLSRCPLAVDDVLQLDKSIQRDPTRKLIRLIISSRLRWRFSFNMVQVIDDDVLMIRSQSIIGRSTTFSINDETESMSSRLRIDHYNKLALVTSVSASNDSYSLLFQFQCLPFCEGTKNIHFLIIRTTIPHNFQRKFRT